MNFKVKQLSLILISCIIPFFLACPRYYNNTGIHVSIQSSSFRYISSQQIPMVHTLQGDTLVLDSSFSDYDSHIIWSNGSLSDREDEIAIFTILVKDTSGLQWEIPLDTIRIKQDCLIDYKVSIDSILNENPKSNPHKLIPITGSSDYLFAEYEYVGSLY
jgi:hypothetical protein